MTKVKKFLIPLFVFICFILPASAIDPNSVESLVPLGNTTGIKIFSDGVIVVDTVEIETVNGRINPAHKAGIMTGDIIKMLNGQTVSTNEELKEVLFKSGKNPIDAKVVRQNQELNLKITPVEDLNGEMKMGLWIRDSMAGIGTLTFYEPKNGIFGALGHGICDTDTNALIPIKNGAIMDSKVTDVKKGRAGEPGELMGEYDLKKDSGVINNNTESGIFGTITEDRKPENKESVPICRKEQVKCGPAKIYSNIDGEQVREYDVEITKVFSDKNAETKNMMIKVTDPELINVTGGIVQGM